MSESPEVQLRNAQRQMRMAMGPLRVFATQAWSECRRLTKANPMLVNDLTQIDVVLVSDRRMAKLHEQFMSIAGPTDVLTFQHGEVVVSVETARENAARFGTSPEQEIRLYIVHGFLHLLGFDDISPKDAREMERLQAEVLQSAGPPNESRVALGPV